MILETAAELFAEQDWDDITLDAIAEEARLVKTTLANHFPRKADLLVEVLFLAISELKEELKGEAEDDLIDHFGRFRIPAAEQTLIARLNTIYQFLFNNRRLTKLLWPVISNRNEDSELWPVSSYLSVIVAVVFDAQYRPSKDSVATILLAEQAVLNLVRNALYAENLTQSQTPYEMDLPFHALFSYMRRHGRLLRIEDYNLDFPPRPGDLIQMLREAGAWHLIYEGPPIEIIETHEQANVEEP